jgi:hypothetical protein
MQKGTHQIVFLNPYFFMKNLAILLDSEEGDLTNLTVETQSNNLV